MAEAPLTSADVRVAIEGLSDSDIGRLATEQGLVSLVSRALMGTAIERGEVVDRGVIQWEIETPDGGGSWQLTFADGAAEAAHGRAAIPDVSLRSSLADFLRVTAGVLSVRSALLQERVTVAGDLTVAVAVYG